MVKVMAAILLAMACTSSLSAAPAQHERTIPLLIGTYTGGSSRGIYVYRFDRQSGRIAPKPVQVVPSPNPSWLTLSAGGRRLYAVNENGPGQRDPVGRVSAWRVDRASGHLTPINRVLSLGAEPTHSSLSRDGRMLFVANYSGATDPGGTLAAVPVAGNGALQPVTQIKTHRASMADPARQLAPHVHSAVSSPDGRFVFAQDLGADRIYVYAYDPAQREAPLAALRDQPWVVLPPGSGPRHLVFSRDGRHAYVTLEMAGAVAVFDHADGHLALRQTLGLAPAGFAGRVGAGALHLSPDGRYLIVADRGTDNSLVTFAVDPATGALQPAERRSVEGEQPREFTIDRSGRFVVVANQHSHAVIVFRRDPATGQIGDRVQSLALDDAADVKLVE
eukprot:gene6396-6462_t